MVLSMSGASLVTRAARGFSASSRAADIPEKSRYIGGNTDLRNGSMEWKLFIPSHYDGITLCPLIIMLHGCGQTADDFAVGTKMNWLGDEANCLVLYPNQASFAHMMGCWTWYSPTHQKRDSGEPELIAATIRQIQEQYTIDPNRIYIAGMSSGGATALTMGIVYPEIFAAVCVHSGLAYRSASTLYQAFDTMQAGHNGYKLSVDLLARAPPVILFHGSEDQIVNARNSQAIVRQFTQNRNLTSETITDRPPTGYPWTRTVWRNEAGEVVLENWLVESMGHAWSQGDPSGSYTDQRGPNASMEMMRFFLEHPKENTE